jgi:hypothetical protein
VGVEQHRPTHVAPFLMEPQSAPVVSYSVVVEPRPARGKRYSRTCRRRRPGSTWKGGPYFSSRHSCVKLLMTARTIFDHSEHRAPTRCTVANTHNAPARRSVITSRFFGVCTPALSSSGTPLATTASNDHEVIGVRATIAKDLETFQVPSESASQVASRVGPRGERHLVSEVGERGAAVLPDSARHTRNRSPMVLLSRRHDFAAWNAGVVPSTNRVPAENSAAGYTVVVRRVGCTDERATAPFECLNEAVANADPEIERMVDMPSNTPPNAEGVEDLGTQSGDVNLPALARAPIARDFAERVTSTQPASTTGVVIEANEPDANDDFLDSSNTIG